MNLAFMHFVQEYGIEIVLSVVSIGMIFATFTLTRSQKADAALVSRLNVELKNLRENAAIVKSSKKPKNSTAKRSKY